MIPTAYEFHWDLGHVVFLGTFYTVLTAVTVALGVAAYHWLTDLRRRRAATIAWAETFHDLPAERRHCRHEFRGTVDRRICDRGFDCAHCPEHRRFVVAEVGSVGAASTDLPAGLRLPAQRLFHRGHTWVEPRADGSLAVGLDDVAAHCIGRPDRLSVASVGCELRPGDPVATVDRGRLQTRVLSPVAGLVVAAGGDTDHELCRIRPNDPAAALEPLLEGREAEVWMLRELESLQRLLATGGAGPTLADGGLLVDDLVEAYPDADWDRIWGHVCLET